MIWNRVVITHNGTKLYAYCSHCGDRLYFNKGDGTDDSGRTTPKGKMFPAICRRHLVCATPVVQRSEASFYATNVHWLWENARGYKA
jgi:hypothetical protein